MAWQLIYTSWVRGLNLGQSGFCTVARSRDLREALCQKLEQLSVYHRLAPAGVGGQGRFPLVCAYRILELRGQRYSVLTRIQDAGLDFTSRTNHIAHHLVFEEREINALPSPAILFRYWPGWCTSWSGEPRYLPGGGPIDLSGTPLTVSLPARTWARLTGDAGRAAGLIEYAAGKGCYLVSAPGTESDLLDLYAEALQLLDPHGRAPANTWRCTFTTALLADGDAIDFQWRAVFPGTPAYASIARRGFRAVAPAEVAAPANELAELARTGRMPRPTPAAAPDGGVKLVRVAGGEAWARSGSRVPVSVHGRFDPYATGGEETEEGGRGAGITITFQSIALVAVLVLAIGLIAFSVGRWSMGRGRGPNVEQSATNVASESGGSTGHGDTAPTGGGSGSPSGFDTNRLIAELNAKFPEMPTVVGLVPFGGGERAALPRFPEIEGLLAAVLNSTNPMPPSAIKVFIRVGQPDFSVPSAGENAGVAIDLHQKYMRLAARSGFELDIDFLHWSLNRKEPVWIESSAGAPPACVGLFFFLQAESPNLAKAFRVLLLRERSVFADLRPVTLPRDSLVWDNTAGRLEPGLYIRPALERIRLLNDNVHIGLRLWDFGTHRDVFADWGPDEHPTRSLVLDMGASRRQLDERVRELERQLRDLAEHRRQFEEELRRTQIRPRFNGLAFPFGRALGLPEGHPLHDFFKYTEGKTGPTNALYLKYLRTVLAEGKTRHVFDAATADQIAAKLEDTNRVTGALADLEEMLRPTEQRGRQGEPTDALMRAWRRLVVLDGLFELENENARLDQELAEVRSRLFQLSNEPSSLGTPCLVLTCGTNQIPLIRFSTDEAFDGQ